MDGILNCQFPFWRENCVVRIAFAVSPNVFLLHSPESEEGEPSVVWQSWRGVVDDAVMYQVSGLDVNAM
jgi:hypothetical protein